MVIDMSKSIKKYCVAMLASLLQLCCSCGRLPRHLPGPVVDPCASRSCISAPRPSITGYAVHKKRPCDWQKMTQSMQYSVAVGYKAENIGHVA